MKSKLSVSCDIFDMHKKGVIYLIVLKNGSVSVAVTNLGCTITGIETPGRDGTLKNIVTGYTNLLDYFDNPHYFGCLLGRFANRIAGAKFKLNGNVYQLLANNGENHLHGGAEGFNKKVWEVGRFIQSKQETGVEFSYVSPDGEEGYPGSLQVKVQYILNDKNQLLLKYLAQTDQPTVVNLANHSYFNLTGFESPNILGHGLQINSTGVTESPDDIPNGNIIPVKGTNLDFSSHKKIGDDTQLFSSGEGYNQNYVLKDYAPGKLAMAAKLSEPLSGRTLSIYTDQPGIQLYTASSWDGTMRGPQGKPYEVPTRPGCQTAF